MTIIEKIDSGTELRDDELFYMILPYIGDKKDIKSNQIHHLQQIVCKMEDRNFLVEFRFDSKRNISFESKSPVDIDKRLVNYEKKLKEQKESEIAHCECYGYDDTGWLNMSSWAD